MSSPSASSPEPEHRLRPGAQQTRRRGGGAEQPAIELSAPLRVIATFGLPPLVTVLCFSLFGPQPIGWLWVGSQVEGATESLGAGLAVAFFGSVTTIIATAWLARRLDVLWVAVRRGAGARPGSGVLEPAMVIGTALAVLAIVFWLFILEGTGPSIAPQVS